MEMLWKEPFGSLKMTCLLAIVHLATAASIGAVTSLSAEDQKNSLVARLQNLATDLYDQESGEIRHMLVTPEFLAFAEKARSFTLEQVGTATRVFLRASESSSSAPCR